MKAITLKNLLLFATAITLAACTPSAQQSQTPKTTAPFLTEAPAGTYKIDPSHADLTFRVNHLGFSVYTARFTTFTAQLHFDPADPTAMSVTATIEPHSLALPSPPEGFLKTL